MVEEGPETETKISVGAGWTACEAQTAFGTGHGDDGLQLPPHDMTVLSRGLAAKSDHPDLRFDSTVSRHLVHRASVAEVFVTDSSALGDHTFAVAAQLPRAHCFGENADLYDFMLLVEVARQAGMLVAHRHLGLSHDLSFAFRSFRLALRDLDCLRVGERPARVVATMRVDLERSPAGRLRGLGCEGVVSIDDMPAFEAQGEQVFFDAGFFQRLRTRAREAKLKRIQPARTRLAQAAPEAVGRRDPRNVVITEPLLIANRSLACTLTVDTSHPYLFDHPLDHVPGNLLLEGARQLAVAGVAQMHGLAASGLALVVAEVDFGDFTELDLPTSITAEVGELQIDMARHLALVPVTVELTQAGSTVAAVRLEVAAY